MQGLTFYELVFTSLCVDAARYDTGDAGYVGADGYVHVMARTDDVINVAGHRLSTGALEEVCVFSERGESRPRLRTTPQVGYISCPSTVCRRCAKVLLTIGRNLSVEAPRLLF